MKLLNIKKPHQIKNASPFYNEKLYCRAFKVAGQSELPESIPFSIYENVYWSVNRLDKHNSMLIVADSTPEKALNRVLVMLARDQLGAVDTITEIW